MLYLFNSAYRPLYLTNVLRTLALPDRYSNEYRYKHTGDFRYISPTFYSNLSSIKRGEECVIIFIDRFGAAGYTYHPLRLGEFVTYRDVNEYIHFQVKLGAFIYPRDIAGFNHELVQALTPSGLPRLTEDDPRNERDGYYAIQESSIFGGKDEFKTGKTAWNSAVEEISKTKAFSTTAEQAPIFLMLDVNDSSKHPLKASSQAETTIFKFHKDTRYELVVTYRFPQQRTDQSARGKVKLDFGEPIRAQKEISIDSHANSVTVPFAPKRFVEEDRGSLAITSAEAKNPIGEVNLEYELGESRSFWVQIVIALIAFSIIGTLIAIDFSKIQPLTFKNIWPVAKIKLFLALLQTIVLYWLFRLIGRKSSDGLCERVGGADLNIQSKTSKTYWSVVPTLPHKPREGWGTLSCCGSRKNNSARFP